MHHLAQQIVASRLHLNTLFNIITSIRYEGQDGRGMHNAFLE